MDNHRRRHYVGHGHHADGRACNMEGQVDMAKVGDKVPSATLRYMSLEGPKAISTDELFAPGRKVVAFALPGAFTPT